MKYCEVLDNCAKIALNLFLSHFKHKYYSVRVGKKEQ